MLDRYTFDQLALFARSVLTHQANMLEMLISPLLASQGIKYTPSKVKKAKPTKTDEQKEEALERAFAMSPFGVRTVKTSDSEVG